MEASSLNFENVYTFRDSVSAFQFQGYRWASVIDRLGIGL